MDFDSFTCEKTAGIGVPAPFCGLRILLVDHDTTSLLNIATVLEEHSFKVTPIELATVALSILREQTDQFDLVMADVNMSNMDCLEFIKCTQLIKDIPIILMSSMMKRVTVEDAVEQGACFVFMKPISVNKLKNVWQHVYRHQKKASQKSENNAHQIEVVDITSCANKPKDGKGKSIVSSGETYQDQAKKDEPEGSKGVRSTESEVNTKGLEVSKTTGKQQKKRKKRMQWTPNLERKFKKAVSKLGEKARPKLVLEMMNAPHLTQRQVSSHLQKYRVHLQEAQNAQQALSSILNQSKLMLETTPTKPTINSFLNSQLKNLKIGETIPLNPISHSQDAVNEEHHQFRSLKETRTSLQTTHKGIQPLDIGSTRGNFSSVSQRLSIPLNSENSFHYRTNEFNHFLDKGHQFNVLNSNELSMNSNKPPQEAYIPQPPVPPTLPPNPDNVLTGLTGSNQELEIDNLIGETTENQNGTYYSWLDKSPLSSSSTQDNVSTRNQNP